MSARRAVAVAGTIVAAACGGGGDGVTPPPGSSVATVVITAPAAPPTFGALGRTVQFAAEARDAGGSVVTGVSLAWASSNQTVATVSASGLVTAVANGTTSVTASGAGKTSTGVTVTVSQVGVTASITPTSPTIGALGSTRQFTAQLRDSTNNALPSPNPVVWSVSNQGTISVSNTGLVTALQVSTPGAADSVRAAIGPSAIIAATPVIVTQVPASILISTPLGDSVLRTTGRTRQLTATVRDSNANALTAQPAVAWTTSAAGVANVNASGLVVAVTDGSANIQAAVGSVTATRTQLVQRYAATFTVAPTSASITTNDGTQPFTGTAQDTNGTDLPITWTSRAPSIATVSPASGAGTTATAQGNGSTYIVMAGGLRTDSASLAVSGQTAITAITVNIGDNFFRSANNNSQNPAVDTLDAGGTVTWNWTGGNPHNVTSTGSPSFAASPTQTSGSYARTLNTTGTYTYICTVHAGMNGTIVVR